MRRRIILGAFKLRAGPDKIRNAALFLLGLVTGLAVGVALLSARLDRVSLEREWLLVKKADLEIQVERLQEELDQALAWGSEPVVREVDAVLQGLDELTRLRVRAEIAAILDDLVGRPVAELDPALAFHLLEGRTVTVEGKKIALTVRAAVLGPKTAFWVELRETGP